MISHKYEDYADRLGIHILDALTAVLLWPAVVVVALWAWRGVPTIYGGESLSGDAVAVAVFIILSICGIGWLSKRLSWFNIPFELDDPRRALMYPSILYLIKLVKLAFSFIIYFILAVAYAPKTLLPIETAVFVFIAFFMLSGAPPYIYRAVKLWKRKDLCQETDSDC
jgi:hypothetical protein